MDYQTITVKEAAKRKKTSIPTIMNWIGSKIIAEKNPRWTILVDDCFQQAKKGKSLGKDLQEKVDFVSQKINQGKNMLDVLTAYEKKAPKKKNSQKVVKNIAKDNSKPWDLGQDVLWCDAKKKSNRMGIIRDVKKRVQVEFRNGQKSWVAKSSLRAINQPTNFYSTTTAKKDVLSITKPSYLEKKAFEFEQQILALKEEIECAIAERDKARAYRIDLENKKNEMHSQISELQEALSEKQEVVDMQKSQIDELKERLYEQHSRANRSEFENEKLNKTLEEYKNNLTSTKKELEHTTALKNYNQSEKMSLQDQIVEKVKDVVCIPANSNIAKRRQEDIEAGRPVSDNIQVIDVDALQARLIREAKEKYKNHAFVKVMNETARKKAENDKKKNIS
ncbi:hypothetical protein [Candidatus Uabimicrobium sp. HlEnr_7]|uniref:hypothetical protein n=1 Tax=Candidatus Uabimicrobium helgolandensis TaxID=3095367 RepID=UPI0035586B07